jgi:RNA polymerase sigma-70 factor (ECF subfamily)
LPALGISTGPPATRRAPTPVKGLKSQSDEELLVGLRQGSDSHFSELYERYFHRIYTFSYARLRNHADAEEIAQETFMAVFRSVEAFRGQASLLSWIYGIAKNTINNHLRRQKTQEQRLDAAEPELVGPSISMVDAGPAEQLDMRLYTDALEARLGSLADWQLEIFCMRHLENLSISEICDRTQRSGDAVRSSLYRVKRVFFETADGEHAQ